MPQDFIMQITARHNAMNMGPCNPPDAATRALLDADTRREAQKIIDAVSCPSCGAQPHQCCQPARTPDAAWWHPERAGRYWLTR